MFILHYQHYLLSHTLKYDIFTQISSLPKEVPSVKIQKAKKSLLQYANISPI